MTGWQDISVPVRDGMVSFEGDPTVHLGLAVSMAEGAPCNISRLDFGVHSGTHIDAPVHFIDGAAGIDSISLDILVGPVVVADLRAVDGHFDRAAIDGLAIPRGTERLLFRSRNSALWAESSFVPSEGLDLRAVEPGAYDLVCLPILIPGSDGGPARAIVRRRSS